MGAERRDAASPGQPTEAHLACACIALQILSTCRRQLCLQSNASWRALLGLLCHSMQTVLLFLVLPGMLAMRLPGSAHALHLRPAADVTSLSGLGHSTLLCKAQSLCKSTAEAAAALQNAPEDDTEEEQKGDEGDGEDFLLNDDGRDIELRCGHSSAVKISTNWVPCKALAAC